MRDVLENGFVHRLPADILLLYSSVQAFQRANVNIDVIPVRREDKDYVNVRCHVLQMYGGSGIEHYMDIKSFRVQPGMAHMLNAMLFQPEYQVVDLLKRAQLDPTSIGEESASNFLEKFNQSNWDITTKERIMGLYKALFAKRMDQIVSNGKQRLRNSFVLIRDKQPSLVDLIALGVDAWVVAGESFTARVLRRHGIKAFNKFGPLCFADYSEFLLPAANRVIGLYDKEE